MSDQPPTAEPGGPAAEDWKVGLRFCLQRGGQLLLGQGRVDLLESIDRCGSISAAARELGMSYRRAWELVQAVNAAAGEPLVVAAVGGVQGGGAVLTPRGRWLVQVYRDLFRRLDGTAAGCLNHLLAPDPTPTLHVAAAVSLDDVLEQLVADFRAHEPGVRIRAVFGASNELVDHLLAGAPADLILTADPSQLRRLAAAGLTEADGHVVLAENSLAWIGPSDRPPAFARPADLLRGPLPPIALAEPGCPLGGYTQTYLRDLGAYERVAEGALLADNSRAVVSTVRSGQAEAGLIYTSDAGRAAGCRVLFRVRRGAALIRYAGAVVRTSRHPARARRLLEFLASATAAKRFRHAGFLRPR